MLHFGFKEASANSWVDHVQCNSAILKIRIKQIRLKYVLGDFNARHFSKIPSRVEVAREDLYQLQYLTL